MGFTSWHQQHIVCVWLWFVFFPPLHPKRKTKLFKLFLKNEKLYRHFERWWSLWWVIIIFFFFLSFGGEFLGYFEVLPSWTGWRFVRSRSCNDPCRRMTLLLPPANKRKKWKNITTCRNIIIKRFCYCGHCRSWHTKDKFKKKDTKNESVSFCVFFSFFLFNPLRAWNGNEQQGKHTKKRRRGREGRLVVQ